SWIPLSAESGLGSRTRLGRLDFAITRRRGGDQHVQELPSDLRSSLHRALEGGFVRFRGFVHARELAHELERRGAHLVVGDRRFEVEQSPDVAAHGDSSTETPILATEAIVLGHRPSPSSAASAGSSAREATVKSTPSGSAAEIRSKYSRSRRASTITTSPRSSSERINLPTICFRLRS